MFVSVNSVILIKSGSYRDMEFDFRTIFEVAKTARRSSIRFSINSEIDK